jgi:peptide/nickel transport system permease protein
VTIVGFRWLRLVRVVGRRLLLAVPLVVSVTALSFVLVSLTPGDAATEILGVNATPAQYANLRNAMGLNHPLYVQYWDWLRHALTGNLGSSLLSGQSVTAAVGSRIGVTLCLIVGSLLLTTILGISLGVISAVMGGVVGKIVDVLAWVGFALPAFWLGAELIEGFAVKLNWLPATGFVPFGQSPLEWLRSLVLPVFTLALWGIAATAKQTREAMLEALGSEYVRMAWANGVPALSIVMKHALKNASLRVLTVLGVQAVGLLGGTVVVEDVFALPGLGSLVVRASIQHDLPVVEGIVLYFTLMVVAINLVIDLLYAWLNPVVTFQ